MLKYRWAGSVTGSVWVLLATVMAMGGIYRGMVEDALSIVRAPGADIGWVQKDTNGRSRKPRGSRMIFTDVRAVAGGTRSQSDGVSIASVDYGEISFPRADIGYRLAISAPSLGWQRVSAGGEPLRDVIDRKAGMSLGLRDCRWPA